MTKAKNNQQEGQQALEKALIKALENESFLEGLSKKVAQKLEGELITRTSSKPEIVWKRNLEEAGLTLAEGTSLERAAELYPLNAEEIEGVVNNIKTSKIKKPLTLNIIGDNVVIYLGDIELRNRVSEFLDNRLSCYPIREHKAMPCETILSHKCEDSLPFYCQNDIREMIQERATSNPKYDRIKKIDIPQTGKPETHQTPPDPNTTAQMIKAVIDFFRICDNAFWKPLIPQNIRNPKIQD